MYYKINLIGNITKVMGYELAEPIIGEVSPNFYYAASSEKELLEKVDLLKKRNSKYEITDVIKEEIPEADFLALAKRELLEMGAMLEARELSMTQEEFDDQKDALLLDENFYAKCITNVLSLVNSYPIRLPQARKDNVS